MTHTTKFNIGDQVYVYTKSGLQLLAIVSIMVIIDQDEDVETKLEIKEKYYFSRYGDSYSLDQIIATNIHGAINELSKQSKQLQLTLL